MAADMDALAAKLAEPEFAELTDSEATVLLNSESETRIVSRFGSFRTIAALVSETEYNTLRAVLDKAAAASRLIADMIRMLELPGDETGNGGGIDLGSAEVRARIEALCTAAGIPEASGKILAHAERQISWAELHSFVPCVNVLDVERARQEGGLSY